MVIHPRMNVFQAPKLGNQGWEWEDGAAGFGGDPALGLAPRYAVADGATEGFGSARWAECLVRGFVGAGPLGGPVEPPPMRPDALGEWLRAAQAEWHQHPRLADATDLQRLKLVRVGSFATLLCCELTGLAGACPRWDAVALGDSVLFHVRDDQLIAQFPPIAGTEFGVNPDGVSTKPERLAATLARLRRDGGELAVGDRLYLATDALAHWLVDTDQYNARPLWQTLAMLDPPSFRELVTQRRRCGEMTNDDITLLRVHLSAVAPTIPVVVRT